MQAKRTARPRHAAQPAAAKKRRAAKTAAGKSATAERDLGPTVSDGVGHQLTHQDLSIGQEIGIELITVLSDESTSQLRRVRAGWKRDYGPRPGLIIGCVHTF